jgi:hypothetical protein
VSFGGYPKNKTAAGPFYPAAVKTFQFSTKDV